jgi:hypothetical protein
MTLEISPEDRTGRRLGFAELMETQGLRQPRGKLQRFLRVCFSDAKIVRRFLGGTWCYIRLEPGYACWFWAMDNAKWIETDKTIERKEKW